MASLTIHFDFEFAGYIFTQKPTSAAPFRHFFVFVCVFMVYVGMIG